MMTDWQQRMVDEYRDLCDKIAKGTIFLCTGEMTGTEKVFLRDQIVAMMQYHQALQRRLDLYNLSY